MSPDQALAGSPALVPRSRAGLAAPRLRPAWACAVFAATALLESCGGPPPNCDPHPCPSWSRLDPYTCTCVDLDSAQASQPLTARAAEAAGSDAGARPSH